MSDITERGSNTVWGWERSSTKGVTFGLDFKRWADICKRVEDTPQVEIETRTLPRRGNSKDMSRVEGVCGRREDKR